MPYISAVETFVVTEILVAHDGMRVEIHCPDYQTATKVEWWCQENEPYFLDDIFGQGVISFPNQSRSFFLKKVE